jgi:hypothetical protein
LKSREVRNLGGREVWKAWEGRSIGRTLSPVMSVFLLLHIHCECYHSGDYRTERLVLSITFVLHVVQIHINISIYYSLVHHVGVLDKNISGTRTQLL